MDTVLVILDAVVVIAIALFGLVIGSFLNVLIWRVPKKESVVSPSSHCPKCEHPLAAKDNIPIISYLLARGRCRYCGEPISIQYPLVEAAGAGIPILLYFKYGWSFTLIIAALFVYVLFTVSVIDIRHKIIPNVIILPAIVTGLLLVGLSELGGIVHMPLIDRPSWLFSLLGFLVGGGFLFLLALVWSGGMGGGDIKLASFMGIFLGRYILIALFLGFLLGAVGGLAAMALAGLSRKDLIPFGPYLAAGALLTLYFGVPLANWYLSVSGFGL